MALDYPDPTAPAAFQQQRLRIPGSSDLGFQQGLDHVPPSWPDGTGEQPRPGSWRVFLDPAGHPFCLVRG